VKPARSSVVPAPQPAAMQQQQLPPSVWGQLRTPAVTAATLLLGSSLQQLPPALLCACRATAHAAI